MTINATLSAYGESTYNGYYSGVDHQVSTIPYQVQQNDFTNSNITLENHAQDGKGIFEQNGVGQPMAALTIAGNKPGVAMINMGLNDAYKERTEAQFLADFNAVVDALRRTGKLVYIQASNAAGASAAYLYHPGGTVDGRTIQQQVAQFATDTYAKGNGTMTGVGRINLLVTPPEVVDMSDGFHPSAAGYSQMYSEALQTISTNIMLNAQYVTWVSMLYAGILLKAAEQGGLNFWVGSLSQAGNNINTVAGGIMGSTEGLAMYPASLDNNTFVSNFYTNALGRAVDAGGLTFWSNALQGYLNAGDSQALARGKVAVGILDATYNYTGTDTAVITSQKLVQNRTSVSMTYGWIFGKTTVDGTVPAGTNGTVSGFRNVTSDPQTILNATAAY